MTETTLASYEDVAPEYYDPKRHPTCANFREASALLIGRWLREFAPRAGVFCEVGAGRSLLAELTADLSLGEARLVLTDSSPSMLSYSRRWAGPNASLVVADSARLPFAAGSFDLLVSSLGDPYNDLSFWREARRTLRPGGAVFFTTPSHDWATAFRGRDRDGSAEFELSNGESVYVPSKIYPRSAQIELIESAGLLARAGRHAEVLLSDIKSSALSPKLLADRGADASIVEGYLAIKPPAPRGEPRAGRNPGR